MNECIYCGAKTDLSKSDIIPDALTNAKIINRNVCRVKHNNEFSDLFEDEVIKDLALITNALDIKSSKSKSYASYPIQTNIAGIEYSAKISSDTDLFRDGKKMRSTDKRFLLGPLEDIKKIKNSNEQNTTEVDLNQLEIDTEANFSLEVFFSEKMYRLIAKIAFEWYCSHNEVNFQLSAFQPLSQFIINGGKNDKVTLVNDEKLYSDIVGGSDHGSHTIISYIGKDDSINVLVNLFGIVIYNVKVCDFLLEECKSNVIFQELRVDATRFNFKYNTFEDFNDDFMSRFNKIEYSNEPIVFVPKDMKDKSLKYLAIYSSNYSSFQEESNFTIEPTQKIINILLSNIEKTLQSAALTLRGLKRFVTEYFKDFDKEINLDPNKVDPKSLFMFYILLIIGQSDSTIKNMNDLNIVVKERFSSGTIDMRDTLMRKLTEEVFSTEGSSSFILKGAKEINVWSYE